MHSRRLIAPVAATLGLALAAAGCGGGSGSPQVANLGGTGTTATTPAGAPAGSAPGVGGAGLTMRTQNGLKVAQCMRSHGIANFPDPNGQGALSIGPSSGIDPRSAKFQAAMEACRKLVGGGTGFHPSAAQLQKIKLQALRFSACMRSHGLPDFPDPQFSTTGGGITMRLSARSGGDLNPSSPAFQAAQRACQGILPGKGGHAGVTAQAGGK